MKNWREEPMTAKQKEFIEGAFEFSDYPLEPLVETMNDIACKNCKYGLLIPKSKEKTGKGIYYCKRLSIWQRDKELTLYEEDDTCENAQANESDDEN